jgi:hypothetical protein
LFGSSERISPFTLALGLYKTTSGSPKAVSTDSKRL